MDDHDAIFDFVLIFEVCVQPGEFGFQGSEKWWWRARVESCYTFCPPISHILPHFSWGMRHSTRNLRKERAHDPSAGALHQGNTFPMGRGSEEAPSAWQKENVLRWSSICDQLVVRAKDCRPMKALTVFLASVELQDGLGGTSQYCLKHLYFIQYRRQALLAPLLS